MAEWYVSSVAWAAIPQFAISTGYLVGNIIRPLTPVAKRSWAFRCTTAGTSAGSEPTWGSSNNGTTVSGTATFTHVTGQSTYGWSAPAGDFSTLQGESVGTVRAQSGDTVYVSSDHAESTTGNTQLGSGIITATTSLLKILSVNRAGSVPPVAADLQYGATFTVSTNTLVLNAYCPTYIYGCIYAYTGTTAAAISLGSSTHKTLWLDNCQIFLNTATSTCLIAAGAAAMNTILHNTTMQFGHTSQSINCNGNNLLLQWFNTPSAIAGATIPATLFLGNTAVGPGIVTVRGVDLSAITGTLVGHGSNVSNPGWKILFDSCKIAAAVTRYSTSNIINTRDEVDLVNCFDGTNIINESYQVPGAITTERTITLASGATDDVGTFSHKMVSNAAIGKLVNTLNSAWLDVENIIVAGTKTATVEIISSGSLNNDEISIELEYQGTASSSVASFANSLPATVQTAAAAVTISTATWNSSPGTPVKQKLEVSFAPRQAGRLRARVRLGKASTTVYINPQITVT